MHSIFDYKGKNDPQCTGEYSDYYVMGGLCGVIPCTQRRTAIGGPNSSYDNEEEYIFAHPHLISNIRIKYYVERATGRIGQLSYLNNTQEFNECSPAHLEAMSQTLRDDLWARYRNRMKPVRHDALISEYYSNRTAFMSTYGENATPDTVLAQEFDEPLPANAKRSRGVLASDVARSDFGTWLIDGVLPSVGSAILYGDTSSYKTTVALDIMLRGSHGLNWCGQAIQMKGAIWLAGEGQAGIRARIQAWATQNQQPLEEINDLLVYPDQLNLSSRRVAEELVRSIRRDIDRFRFNSLNLSAVSIPSNATPSPSLPSSPPKMMLDVGIIVIDTLNRYMGGEDENNAAKVAQVIENCEYIAKSLNALVLILSHSTKDGTALRGSSALKGNVDVALNISNRNGLITVKQVKNRDGETGKTFEFRPAVVDLPISQGRIDQHVTVEHIVKSPNNKPSGPMRRGQWQSIALAYLGNTGPTKAKDLVDYLVANKCPQRTAYNTITSMEKSGFIHRPSTSPETIALVPMQP